MAAAASRHGLQVRISGTIASATRRIAIARNRDLIAPTIACCLTRTRTATTLSSYRSPRHLPVRFTGCFSGLLRQLLLLLLLLPVQQLRLLLASQVRLVVNTLAVKIISHGHHANILSIELLVWRLPAGTAFKFE